MPSSVIAQLHYHQETRTLRVTYVSGKVYDYQGVPEKIYKHMMAAASKGKYLNEQIKGHYDFVKIKD